jgi:prevent-host-death family protein
MIVNIHEAKTHLSQLVDRAAAGEEIIIARAGKPVCRLAPLTPARQPRTLGLFAGEPFSMASDFDHLPDDVAAAFEGAPDGGGRS